MRTCVGCFLPAILVALVAPATASAQVRGFSRQQQAALLIYQQQIATQQRIQQQQQMQVLRQSLLAQQQQLGQQARIQKRTLDLLTDPEAALGAPPIGGRGTAVFGEMHYNSSMFNRIGPYYDYQFVMRRNRPVPVVLSNQRGLPYSGYGGIIFGNSFGLITPYW